LLTFIGKHSLSGYYNSEKKRKKKKKNDGETWGWGESPEFITDLQLDLVMKE
jgi:hypothetical protein